MAELTLTREQLNTLIVSESARGSRDIARIVNFIRLTYRRSEIVTPLAPRLALPQQIVSITLDGVLYTDRAAWTLAWQQIYDQNRRTGVSVFPDRSTAITAANITDSQGIPLPLLAAPVTVPEAPTQSQGTVGITVIGEQGVPGVGIGSVFVDSAGDLRVILDDGQDITAGQVVPTIQIGTVSQNASGQGSTASLTGSAPNYVLNLNLDTSATTGNFVGTVRLTAQGTTADSAVRVDTLARAKIDNIAFTIALGS